MDKLSRKQFYCLLIFSLFLLFNPNINIFDPLPDFIAWFILAKLFEKAADSAAYFEEARVSFIKLGWLNLAKLPAFLFILLVRGENIHDNDVYTLISFSFAIVEAIFVIQAVNYVFKALTHLGERTSASALISPFSLTKNGGRTMTPEMLKGYTYFFAVCKSILYTLPDMFLLTRVNDKGQILTASKYYPDALIFSQILGLIVGAVWLTRMIKHAKAVYTQGHFKEAVESMATEDTELKYSTKKKIRSIASALTLMAVSSFFTLEIAFDNFKGINILPHFIYGIFLILSFLKLQNYTSKSKSTFVFGSLFTITSLVAYIFSIKFLSSYSYLDLINNSLARDSYFLVQIFGICEFIILSIFLILSLRTLKGFILTNTGVSPNSDRYLRMEKEYHASLIKKAYIFTGLGIVAALAKCVNIFLNRDVQLVFTNINEVMVAASPIPWFNLVVTVTAVAYIAYSLYFTSALKEEVRMKYTIE